MDGDGEWLQGRQPSLWILCSEQAPASAVGGQGGREVKAALTSPVTAPGLTMQQELSLMLS